MTDNDAIAAAHAEMVRAAEEAARDPFKAEVTALCDVGLDADWINTGGGCMAIEVSLPASGGEILINGIFSSDGAPGVDFYVDNLIDREDLVGFTLALFDPEHENVWCEGEGFEDGGVTVKSLDPYALVAAVRQLGDDATRLFQSMERA